MIQVSVVVPTLGRLRHLEGCLRALATQTYSPIQVIVVHDGPDPEVVQELTQSFGARYVRGPGTGVVQAYNVGLKESGGDVIAFTDDDTVAEKDWVEKLACAFSPDVGGVGGTVMHAGAGDSEIPLTPTRITGEGRFGGWLRLSDRIMDVDHLRGANMSFSKEAISGTGLFDWNYAGDGHKFESDYCIRMRRRGYRILFNPKAVVIHAESNLRPVPRNRTPAKAYYRSRNNTYFALKNFMFGRHSFLIVEKIIQRVLRKVKFVLLRRDVTYAFELLGLTVGASRYMFNRLMGRSLSAIGF